MNSTFLLGFVCFAIPGILGSCCPNGWYTYGESCYFFADEASVDWTEATHFCSTHGAHLVTIETAAEDMGIKDQARKLFKGGLKNSAFFWIGATDDEVEGQWYWYTDHSPVTYTSWAEPVTDPNSDCALLWGPFDFNWGDYPCDHKGHAICEKSLNDNGVLIG